MPGAAPQSLPRAGSAANVAPNYGVNELPEPPVVKAVKGVANVSLIADVNPATGLPSFRYDGMQGIIPTIELKPGETFVVDVQDDLPPSGKMYDDVNLHFHGLTVSPRGNADDVLHRLATPGQSLHYVVHVPKNQEPGLYWYHSHVHGQTSYQVGEGGMSGAILIDGLEQHIPALAKMKQRVIIVRFDRHRHQRSAAARRRHVGRRHVRYVRRKQVERFGRAGPDWIAEHVRHER